MINQSLMCDRCALDRDGTIDMILSVCPHEGNNKDCSIQIAYNDQIPLCTSSSKEDEECRDLENLCTKDEEFKFPDLTSSTVPNPVTFLSSILSSISQEPRELTPGCVRRV